jgi:c-di-GMP-binding flagellar brake protein YcgR
MGSYADKRKFQRLTLYIDVMFKIYRDYQRHIFLDEKEIHVATIDISEGGIGIQSSQLIPEKSILDILINVTNLNKKGEFEFNRPIEATGKVCWVNPLEDGSFRMGIAFIKIAEEDRSNIRKFIGKHIHETEKRVRERENQYGRRYPRYKTDREKNEDV